MKPYRDPPCVTRLATEGQRGAMSIGLHDGCCTCAVIGKAAGRRNQKKNPLAASTSAATTVTRL
jgi:hypothetical protein